MGKCWVDEANERIYFDFKVLQAKSILKIAKETFGDNLAVAFSGGKDSLVVLHLALETLGPDIPVIFNNTTIEFPETIQYVLNLSKMWGFKLHVTNPNRNFFSAVKEHGWATHENRWCCKPYKDEPAYKYMIEHGIMAEITGVTRTESFYRRYLKPFTMPKKDPPILRINPIYDWNSQEVWRYIKERNLPYNPLYNMGYQRIGCWCCPLKGISHYRRMQKTHPNLYSFLKNFEPKHPAFKI
ncbi:MAG: phosphoadenosine phosphosulfate reductase family protein [archaeon YNP-LCB-003-016]|jgi:phosphoadenosine phosphosulfate reductase|uniref:phosphoadenosine phosphosulfate reductase family protein n=1 Tax=Candidatus Culexarchaeum yellowstonense TaxID=2928963 RepID=UPI0026EDE3EE|nr:phosphoadenosine phosphosulfate reductase family protein [Candidatus Culexarchaeum yellowstonense]MCR6693219.1 phosphoadenosine phosphosulfate reductase family protein [Candidatus Culexarchaeum yellowstonense]